MVSARSDLSDKLAAFEHGADDYMTKPFALAEVEARVRALLNRARGGCASRSGASLRRVDFDTAEHEAHVGAETVRLTPKAAQILEVLMRARASWFAAPQIEQTIWGARSAAMPMRCAARCTAAPGPRPMPASTASRPCTASAIASIDRGPRPAGWRMARRLHADRRVVWAVTGAVALLIGLQTVLAFVAMQRRKTS